MDSIIEMIEKNRSCVAFESHQYERGYNEACDDIIEQLRKMSDEPREPYVWAWLFHYGEISSRHYKTKKQAENDWASLAGGKAIPLYK